MDKFDAFHIVKPLNAEVLMSDHPVNHIHDLSALDVVVENQPYASKNQRYCAYDRVSYDPDPESKYRIHGYGATRAEAVKELLDQLEDLRETM